MARDKKKSGMRLDTDSMIWRAMSLQRAARELERNQDNSKHDTLLFSGVFIAVPVLLALATEIALRAWLYREGKESPDLRHDFQIYSYKWYRRPYMTFSASLPSLIGNCLAIRY